MVEIGVMRPGIILSVGLTLAVGVPAAQGGIEELAREGQWQRLLQVANRPLQRFNGEVPDFVSCL